MGNKLLIFITLCLLIVVMLFIANENIKEGFFYYILLFILSIGAISLFFTFILKNIDDNLYKLVNKFIVILSKINLLSKKTKDIYNKYKQFKIIIGFTLIWIFFILYLISFQKDGFDWCFLINIKADGLTLNEWGDFSAGFIAPLALGWLAYSIYYQKKEFENVKEAFVDQQDILKDQVTKLEIDQLHTWFERNTSRINVLLAKIQKEKISNNDTPQLINEDFSLITQESKYFEIFDEIRNILKIDEFILSSLIESSKNEEVNKAIRELLIEYQLLYGEHIKFSKIILLKVYLCIAMHEKEIKGEFKYEKYKVYSDWLTKDLKDKIIEFVNSQESKLIEEQINLAFEKIYLNFDWISINKE